MSGREITGRQVFIVTASAFAVIIGVNVTLAVKAVQTFPGLETKNSYVASQRFEADRAAQEGLGWTAALSYDGDAISLAFTGDDGAVVHPAIANATLGRATHVQSDLTPEFKWTGAAYAAVADLAPGNWNLRLTALAADGTEFRQRIVLIVDDPS